MILFDKLITSEQDILFKIFNSKINSALLLTYFNQHCFNIYFKNNDYQKLINEYFLVYSEGIGMNLFYKFILKKRIKRIDAAFLYTLMEEIGNRLENIFLVGGNFNRGEMINILKKKGLNLTGYQNGFFIEDEKTTILEKISLSNAKFILVGMGVPKQEFFAYELSKVSKDKVIICVGNFLEFYFGTIKRAPKIFQKLGVEWLFRLIVEPRRLWKRYLIGIPEFIYRAIKIKLSRMI
jgi:N-acetylglucosaminyldiphosphoundecaprenol N-acetyl-beta-D-mannosaminyltransferase